MIVPEATYQQQASSSSSAAATDQKKQIDQDTFLKLLMTQLEHQDPLNPMDSMQFTSQLAQFSQVEQMVDCNKKLDSLAQYQSSFNNWQSVGMIGKEVTAPGDWVQLQNGVPGKAGYSLQNDSSQVTVKIVNSQGKLVRTLNLGVQGKGDHLIQWDGKGDNGTTLPDGRYTIQVNDGSSNGASQIGTFVQGVVTGVAFDQGTPSLLIAGEKVPFSSVTQIQDVSKS